MKITQIFLFFTLFILQLNVLAEVPKAELNIKDISAILYKIEADIEDERFLLEHLDDYLDKLPTYAVWAQSCVDNTSNKLKDNTSRLEKLGEFIEGEPADVAFTRKNLSDKKSTLVNSQSSCKAILVRSETSIKNISLFRKVNLERKSLHRGMSIITVLQHAISTDDYSKTHLDGLKASSKDFKVLQGSELIMLISILIFTVIVGVFIQGRLSRWDSKNLKRWQVQHPEKADTGSRFFASQMMTIRRFALPLLVTSGLAIFITAVTLDEIPIPLITIITYNLPLLVFAFSVTFFALKALPELGLKPSTEMATLRSLRIRLNILIIVVFIGHLLFQTILANSLPESVYFLARAILGLLLVLNLTWALWLTHKLGGSGLSIKTRILITVVLIGALIAELTGYRNLSSYILQGVAGSLLAYALLKTSSFLLKRFLTEINTGKYGWQLRLRRSIGIRDGETIPGFIWINFFITLIIWALFIAVLLVVWGVPEADIRVATSMITQGFSIGSFKFVPLKVFEAILVFLALLALNGWFQKRFDKKFLSMAGVERGARESISTITNYLGIAIAIIISLAIAGLDFSKLAIIVGALSVGIGFGLQNIVNNFVSGLILLFERPIKTGDWIAAGGVEGYVKKISIRSTQIETFDRADIIIPNAELISGNLTNWELKDQSARIRVPVGVAYGSDTGLVKELLLKVANEHDAVINKRFNLPEPDVMFLSFGDSSLDFELRCFIKDIKKRAVVISDLNFSIDAIFRQNNIEIPFPQRDVHLHEKSTATQPSIDDEQSDSDVKDSSAD